MLEDTQYTGMCGLVFFCSCEVLLFFVHGFGRLQCEVSLLLRSSIGAEMVKASHKAHL